MRLKYGVKSKKETKTGDGIRTFRDHHLTFNQLCLVSYLYSESAQWRWNKSHDRVGPKTTQYLNVKKDATVEA